MYRYCVVYKCRLCGEEYEINDTKQIVLATLIRHVDYIPYGTRQDILDAEPHEMIKRHICNGDVDQIGLAHFIGIRKHKND